MAYFREKVVLVTGASSGIGEATAIKLAEHGARLFLVALEEDKLQIVQQKCKEKGLVEEKIGYCSGDLSQSAVREEIVKNLIQKFGRLDILADIAGSVLFANVCETKEEDYDRFVRVNQKAKFFLAQLCLPYLKQTKGNIIYMSSIDSTMPQPEVVVYCMAKVAIDMLTKCLAKGRLVDRRNVNTSRTCPFHLAICSGRRFEWIVHFYVLKFCIHMLSVYLDGIEPTSLWFLLHGEPSKPKAKLMPSFSVKL
ncbi:Hypothetical predicted protein [Mytilus galloprovincialis]|uniref:Uncharacterized protein n=1 Tax=Mytilus galloprovincialis TaxID=29158 RepID=A0A8B6H8X6_MYTGA|nr:Hypothetical predicted protein [Mytilus galloprovincialis]